MPVIDVAVAVGSMIFPPVFDLFKRKLLGHDDGTPESTLAALAESKPEVMGEYVKALADLKKAETEHYSRDVIGTPAQWLVTYRAAIRPLGTTLALMALVAAWLTQIPLEDPIRLTLEAIVGSWFGTRISFGTVPGTGAASSTKVR